MTQNVSLNLNDLKNAVNVMDYAASQGAFKGWETIKQVMEIRDKFAMFLQSAEAAEAARVQAQASSAPEAEITYDDDVAVEEPKTKKRAAKK